MKQTVIYLCALISEARPFIEALKLKSRTLMGLQIFERDNTWLIITGIGKMQAALAVGVLQGALKTSNALWINIGLAGHPHLPIGTGALAHKVIDMGTKQTYYPTFITPLKCPTISVYTVEKPETLFSHEAGYEMEASGFMQGALRFSSSEIVHCYKIISDNKKESIVMKPASVEKLIKPHRETVFSFVERLLKATSHLEDDSPHFYSDFLSRWHFTSSQGHKLKKLLFHVTPEQAHKATSMKSSSEVLAFLETQVRSTPIDIVCSQPST